MDKKSLKTGLVIGAVLGGVAAYFLTPRSGKESREMAAQQLKDLQKLLKEKDIDEIVRDIYGKVTEEGKKMFKKARNEISDKLAQMKESLEDIDKEKYVQLVEDVIQRLQSESDLAKEHVLELKEYFIERWGLAQKMAEEDAEEVTKKTKKAIAEEKKKPN